MPSWVMPLVGNLLTIVGLAIVFGRRDGETRTQIQNLGRAIDDLAKLVGEKQNKSEMQLQVELQDAKREAMDRLHGERIEGVQKSIAELRQVIASSHHRLRGDLMILSTGGKLRTDDGSTIP